MVALARGTSSEPSHCLSDQLRLGEVENPPTKVSVLLYLLPANDAPCSGRHFAAKISANDLNLAELWPINPRGEQPGAALAGAAHARSCAYAPRAARCGARGRRARRAPPARDGPRPPAVDGPLTRPSSR